MIKKILISQPKPTAENSPYFSTAEKLGIEMVFRPFIKVERVSVREFRDQRINILDYTAVVFTSRHAIDFFFQMCQDLRVTIPATMKYFCITETVALYIQKYIQYRKRKIFFGSTGQIADLMPLMTKHSSERFFIPQSEVHKKDFALLLEKNKLNYKEGIMYRTVSNDFTPDESFDYDMIVFFSPSGVQAFKKNFPQFTQGDVAVACLGPATAKAVEEAGLTLHIEAPTKEYPSILSAITAYVKKVNG